MSNNIGLKFIEENGVLAPCYKLEFNGVEPDEEIYRCLLEIVYESSEEVIDKLELTFQNPEFKLGEMKMFLPGNEISLWLGYNGQLQYIGRGVIYHHKIFFPRSDISTLEIKAYPKSFTMTEKHPVIKKKGEKNVKRKDPTVWGKRPLDDVFDDIANRHELKNNSDACGIMNPVNQPKHMSDYDFCTRLANLADFYFWVDADETGTWRLNFRSPKILKVLQNDIYTFKYNSGNQTSLFEFEPEMVLTKQYTKIRAEMTTANRKTITAEFEEDKTLKSDIKPEKEREEIAEAIGSPTSVKVYLEDYSFMIPAIDSIKTSKDLQAYVDRWVKRNREEFILANGKTIGIPNLQARQEHKIDGVGKLYNGTWHFIRVLHRFNETDGYSCEFDARKEF